MQFTRKKKKININPSRVERKSKNFFEATYRITEQEVLTYEHFVGSYKGHGREIKSIWNNI